MNFVEYERIERRAKQLRTRELARIASLAMDQLVRVLVREPIEAVIALFPRRPAKKTRDDDPAAERFTGLANFQDRLKNSRPPRIAAIRSTNRSKCSGTSTKLRRSLFTMSSGLSE
jgi:hypothetical protein